MSNEMSFPDYAVLVGYFVMMIGIGIYSARRIKRQEDFFMGGRSFGKLLQTFAAFGAGTGSSDPVNTGRTTFTSGMSGMWSVMSWLFVTPFYWITGVWYRRMRHLTLGDWFVERYESKLLGAAYTVFALLFMIVYGSMLFSAIGKVAAPLVGWDEFTLGGVNYPIEYFLVPVIGVVVLVYGIAGGLEAAYFTDLVQGICIILLSVILIPFGLNALVDKFGGDGMLDGFRIIHEQVPAEFFSVVGSSSSEFPLHRIIAVIVISLVGVVVQPHFIATGGGSAKTETNARVGLVVGNFLKRFCTIGWVLTALIALALFADRPELVADPDKTWGVASRELLGPGLTGLMLACLLAALMSSVDAYMVVGSGLVVRNLYAAFVNPKASEKTYITLARCTGVIVVGGAVYVSLNMMDVFKQLQLTWIFPVVFAAPFWVGMFWRKATTQAAWGTVAFCALMFFVLPRVLPDAFPALRTASLLSGANVAVDTTTARSAAPSDVARRSAAIELWNTALAENGGDEDRTAETRGARPGLLELGDPIEETTSIGGTAIFWAGGVTPIDEAGDELPHIKPVVISDERDGNVRVVKKQYAPDVRLRGDGQLNLDFLLYKVVGLPMQNYSDALLKTLELPPKIIAPFLVMILLSLVTPKNSTAALDRYYAKKKRTWSKRKKTWKRCWR